MLALGVEQMPYVAYVAWYGIIIWTIIIRPSRPSIQLDEILVCVHRDPPPEQKPSELLKKRENERKNYRERKREGKHRLRGHPN